MRGAAKAKVTRVPGPTVTDWDASPYLQPGRAWGSTSAVQLLNRLPAVQRADEHEAQLRCDRWLE